MNEYPSAPPRLIEGNDSVAEVLRAAHHPALASDEARAWDALEPRLARSAPRRWRPWFAWGGLVPALVVAGLWLGPKLFEGQGPVAEVPAESVSSTRPRSLPAGSSRVADGSLVRLEDHGAAVVSETPSGETRIALQRGRLEAEVASQRSGRSFVVAVAGHEFRVLGTRFTVRVADSGPRLQVAEGRVAVWRDDVQVATVSAGEAWPPSRPAEPAAPTASSAVPAPIPSTAVTETARDCLQLTRAGRAADAEQCLERCAQGTGFDAELGLYELARLRQNVRGDSGGALAALRAYERRFPSGTFRSEVQLTLVELLKASGRSAEAAQEARAALENGFAPERAGELHWIIAQHLVEVGDCRAAEPHLDAATGAPAERVLALRSRCAPARALASAADAP